MTIAWAASLMLGLGVAVAARAQVERLPTPAGHESGEPSLATASDGRVFLTWIERVGGEKVDGVDTLRFSVLEDGAWSEPRQIARGDDWFVNWADFPSLVALSGDAMAAHWLVRSGDDTYDYDVVIARSTDGGSSWSDPIRPHRDGVKAEHGFVSLLPLREDVVGAAWLDGREMKRDDESRRSMTLRYVELAPDGTLANAALLDERVCECCQTSAAMTSEGPVVVYRNRSSDEVRDIWFVRRVDGRWSKPSSVSDDGWKLRGCPVNGPSVAAAGKEVAVAWFTAVGGRGSVRLVRSPDAGATFGEPLTIDAANPMGRVSVVMLEDSTAWVSWLGVEQGEGVVRLRSVTPDGELGRVVTVASTGTGRNIGFPRMAKAGAGLVVAWTDGGVQTAFVDRQ